MKRVLLFFCCMPVWAFSQNFNQQIFAVQGGFDQTENLSISWTIGENFTETVYLPNQIFTQGFQQSFLKIKQVHFPETEILNVNIFPNPTTGILQVDVQDQVNSVRVEIYDASGKKLYQRDNHSIKSELDLSKYASGVYFMKISDSNSSRISLFDIIKQ